MISPNFPSEQWDGLSANTARVSLTDFQTPDGDDWNQIVAEVMAIQEHLLGNDIGAGTVSGSLISVVEGSSESLVHRTVLTLTAVPITITDATTNGAHGTRKLYDFPEGVIAVLGAVGNLTTTKSGATLDADAVVRFGIGSAAVGTNNDTLSSTEQDLGALTEVTLSSGNSSPKIKPTAAAYLDGSSSPAAARLNIAVAEADHGAGTSTITVSGTITITWAKLGDV
jgi:hypothetical protein